LTTGSMTFGMVSVNGRKRFPSPAAKITAFFIMEPTGTITSVVYMIFSFRIPIIIP